MKTMCPPGYHHNSFVATHALGHMMYSDVYIYIKCMFKFMFPCPHQLVRKMNELCIKIDSTKVAYFGSQLLPIFV